MLADRRERFNERFTSEKYGRLQRLMDERTRASVQFRMAETPCFFAPETLDEIVQAGEELTLQLTENPQYMRDSAATVPERYRVPQESRRPLFLAIDFGLVREPDGTLRPRLVEMQAFPSIFGYQAILSSAYAEVFGIDDCSWFLGGLDEAGYWELLRQEIVSSHDPEQVVLAEVTPTEQKTLPDFHVHADRLGIRIVDVTALKRRGRGLVYESDGREIPVKRIYNRAIVDEMERKGIVPGFDYREELEVEWAGHPNWYFRVSKFSLPYLRHRTVPAAVFLDEWMAGEGRDRLPEKREQWILKPLYSFAGKGITFAPEDTLLRSIPEKERRNYLLQERVQFEPVIQTPQGATQAEIRILYLWPEGKRMQPMISLVRMGRGLMMGVDHNRDKTWVGGSAGFFPKR